VVGYFGGLRVIIELWSYLYAGLSVGFFLGSILGYIVGYHREE
jgi:hypothetical protein